MGGTALSAFFTPRFVTWFGYTLTHVIIAVALVVIGRDLLVRRCATRRVWTPNTDPVVPKLVAALKLPVTWQMSFLYAVTFGGFVAFSTYLPTYLKDIYAFDLTAAGTRTAGFAIAAVIARPDRRHPLRPDRAADRRRASRSAGTAVLAAVVAFQPPLELPAGTDLRRHGVRPRARHGRGVRLGGPARRRRSGSAASTGIVGAAGGLGGFFPPLVMGATFGKVFPGYGFGLSLLVLVAAGALVFTYLGIRPARQASSR